jgi:UDPglucose 6-dehydrogenase
MKSIEKISVCGLGKLGACMAATFAAKGFEVVGLDIDPRKVAKIHAGIAPVDEPHLQEYIQKGQARLSATADPSAVADTDVTFFITPSPSLPDGSFSNEFLEKAMRAVARALRSAGKKGHLFVCSSTTTPGSCESVLIPAIEEELGGKCGTDFGFCYNPEFIALGNVINGLLEPDMVLIGESSDAYGAALESLYRSYNQNAPAIARMSLPSAELTKISVNSYVTMKISFTNQLRMIAERFAGADVRAILDALGSDSRIGKKYLRPGLAFGGPCFPRDNRLLAYVARSRGIEAPLAEATDYVNRLSNDDLYANVTKRVPKGATVLVLGLSYKPDTHITEEAPGLILAQALAKSGYAVLVHDFAANPDNNPKELAGLDYVRDLAGLKARDDIALAAVCCPWPGYEGIALSERTELLRGW